jgi:hypothetical protein
VFVCVHTDTHTYTHMTQVFGLAIYNSVKLDAHFPMVVYKLLMDVKPHTHTHIHTYIRICMAQVFGLAIYNSVILDAHFPMVVYKLLMGVKPAIEDVSDLNPSLYRGLKMLLEFDGDVEEVCMHAFMYICMYMYT